MPRRKYARRTLAREEPVTKRRNVARATSSASPETAAAGSVEIPESSEISPLQPSASTSDPSPSTSAPGPSAEQQPTEEDEIERLLREAESICDAGLMVVHADLNDAAEGSAEEVNDDEICAGHGVTRHAARNVDEDLFLENEELDQLDADPDRSTARSSRAVLGRGPMASTSDKTDEELDAEFLSAREKERGKAKNAKKKQGAPAQASKQSGKRSYVSRLEPESEERMKKAEAMYTRLINANRYHNQRDIALFWGVSRSSFQRHLARIAANPPGKPPALDPTEKEQMTKLLQIGARWGYPLSISKFCAVAESYFRRRHNRQVVEWLASNTDVASRNEDDRPKMPFVKLKDGKKEYSSRPGKDWMRMFIKNSTELSLRIASNRKLSEVRLTKESINQ